MTTLSSDQLDRLAIDTIRTLAIDAVEQAGSGHPGAPMGMAPMAYVVSGSEVHLAVAETLAPGRRRTKHRMTAAAATRPT